MILLNQLIQTLFTARNAKIESYNKEGIQLQNKQLGSLLSSAQHTAFGKEYRFAEISTPEEFAHQVPLSDYESLSGWIDRTRRGESNVLWPGQVKWFAKSSGTTSSKSKFIPVTEQGLKSCHLQGPRDVMAIFSQLYPKTRVFQGKTLTLGGSHRLETLGGSAKVGDLSAILIENTPLWASSRRLPGVDTALLPDFDQKVMAICKECTSQNVTSFAGVPSWNLVLMNRILEYTGKENIHEVWPDMELFTHGGMNFKPYREQYKRLFPDPKMKYLETYNASEGFFAIQDRPERDDMLLMLDYGVYYEFIPTTTLHKPESAVPLEGVQVGVNYAVVISTCNGLWRYQIGDTVEFTSTHPYRIRITGRTKHFINAFGEEIIVDNAEKALERACKASGARLSDYTAGPIYMGDSDQGEHAQGAHQWLVEFEQAPDSMEHFTQVLDLSLQELNSDYEAKRYKDTTLLSPQVMALPEGSFLRWMSARGKSGGQNKVPRLSNDRTYLNSLLECLEESHK